MRLAEASLEREVQQEERERQERVYKTQQRDAVVRAGLEVLAEDCIHEKWPHVLYHGFALYGKENGVVVEYKRGFSDDVWKAVTAIVKRRIQTKVNLDDISLEVKKAEDTLSFMYTSNRVTPALVVDPLRIKDEAYLTDVYRKLEATETLGFLSAEKETLWSEYKINVEGRIIKANIDKPKNWVVLCGRDTRYQYKKCTVPVTYVLA